ncbi:MAG TPA: hypothetical protein K8V23_08330 [Lactobacillus crispatus]|uniref:Uncharacterized protein n=1 Tax=Lactobacillus crispatus TaxID=47770 RepID=A0A921FLC7_9LACO|nr:hypothetical protein [Lactobacillus crispatus]
MAKRIVWHGTFKNFKADAKGNVTLAFSGTGNNINWQWLNEFRQNGSVQLVITSDQTELDLDDNSDDSKQVELFDEKGEPKNESK